MKRLRQIFSFMILLNKKCQDRCDILTFLCVVKFNYFPVGAGCAVGGGVPS